MMKTSYFIICMMFLANITYADQQEDWINHWFHGVQYAKNREFIKSIQEYTKAIDSIQENAISNHFYLYNERGNIYFNAQDFDHAIQDFNFILNNPIASQEDKANALWGRSRAYLALGKLKKFEDDVNALEKMEPIFLLNYVEGQEYVVFRLAPRFRMDKNMESVFIKMLMAKHSIDSEKDVVFTQSGMGIIKKSMSPDAPQGPFFEDK